METRESPLHTNSARSDTGTLLLLSVLEIIIGLIAVILPYFTGIFFVVLLGTTILINGILQLVRASLSRSWGKSVPGIIGIAAGTLIIAHPLFGLTFLALLLALYFFASGISRFILYMKTREDPGSRWMAVGSAVSFILGILIFAGWPGSSAVIIGLFVGINILTGGILNLKFSTKNGKLSL